MNKFYATILFFALAILGGIIGSQLIWPYLAKNSYNINSNQPSIIVENKEIKVTQDSAFAQAIEKATPAIVGFYSDSIYNSISGTGLVLTRDGLVVAPSNLLQKGLNYHFFANGKEYPYQIILRDYKTNLALVKLDANDLKTADFFDIQDLMLGEKFFCLANKFDFSKNPAQQYYFVDYGFFKSIRDDSLIPSVGIDYEKQGNPVFDVSGKVIGIMGIGEKSMKIISSKELKALIELSKKQQ